MLELASNTVKALGIFGRLDPAQEKYFHDMEAKYSKKPASDMDLNLFCHLTLSLTRDAPVTAFPEHLDLLRDLKRFLPLKLKIKRAFVKDEVYVEGEQHIALEFDPLQTQEIVSLVEQRLGSASVKTHYTKVVWFVPKNNQARVIAELKNFDEMVFYDFFLVTNIQNDENTIYTSNRYKI